MVLTPGSRLGTYDVIASIGEGGMGQVYRARDTKLNRDVALKILPDQFANDPDRLARFTREAQTLASLSHPNIAAIYGLEESGGISALVMELVEGEDLSQCLARGAIPIDEALPIAKQIAEALEAAHEQGIIHRDLKPANIKVRSDGTVKVLDFGLAKAMEPMGAASVRNSISPTLTTPAMTQAGVILGTAAYMSPEQARGKPADKRADIWAFGCVFYELLSGRPPFAGETVSEILADVLKSEPAWNALPGSVPPNISTIIRRCLVKDPRQRIRDIGDVRLDLQGAAETGAAESKGPDRQPSPYARLAWMSVAASSLVAAALAIPAVQHLRETPPPETRTEIVTPVTDRPADFALSPDGRQVVFVASDDGASRLWLRSLATPTAQPLAGTEGATFPFWSPDSRSIGFFRGAVLLRLDLGGGAPQTLAASSNGQGGTWNEDGVIMFAANRTSPLLRVSASGGVAAAVTTLDPLQVGHGFPHFLPDGRRFLFHARGAPDTAGVYLGSLDGGAAARLTASDSSGVYLPGQAFREGGWLLWTRASTLVAQRLDVEKAALLGDPVTIADEVASAPFGRGVVSTTATGLVAYRTGVGGKRQLMWVDRSGTARGILGEPDTSILSNPRVAPDGHRVVVARTVQNNTDLWLMDGVRTSRFTFDASFEHYPLWSSDGTRIAFYSTRTGAGDLYQKLTNGTGEERLVASDQPKTPASWSADGRFLLYISIDPQTSNDMWVLPTTANATPSVFLKTPFKETRGAFSPDGRWVAYQSNESGRDEVYVRPFVPPGAEGMAAAVGQLVSTAGGIHPLWRPDGKELYFLNMAGTMMAVPIAVTQSKLEPGTPVVLFPTRIVGGGTDAAQGRQYDVAPDGRFLINTMLEDAGAPITLLQHWHPDGKK